MLDERYLAMRHAMAAGDRDAILALLTGDFVSEDLDGRTRTGLGMADAVAALDIDRSQRTAVTTLTFIAVEGDEAVVRQRYQMTTTERNPYLPEALWTQSCDRWRRVGDTWLLARSTTEKREIVKNGRRRFEARPDPADPSIVSIGIEGPAG
ncbi:MAG TPA: nuclear transport factor 2 family protein [Candidatus Elarobacter sp.]|nr:nuclear transport factor 2 family protein [Candidatus Elarobacter sp.]HEV2739415.1 nuclear transport factor 2 family protein [Candidatus Elarobacter sp.]